MLREVDTSRSLHELIKAAELKNISDPERMRNFGLTTILHIPSLYPSPNSPSTVYRPQLVARKQFDL